MNKMSLMSKPVLDYHAIYFKTPPLTQLFTLSLHDALPISRAGRLAAAAAPAAPAPASATPAELERLARADRKSTRLNSSHVEISYAVFCLKKKNLYNEQNVTYI